MKKQLHIFRSLGEEVSIGWERDDLPMVHVFASVKPGTAFAPSNGRGGPHWPCKVCEHHDYTEADFDAQMTEIMERAAGLH